METGTVDASVLCDDLILEGYRRLSNDNLRSARKLFTRAVEIARGAQYIRGECEASVGLGDTFIELCKFVDAINQYKIALKIALEKGYIRCEVEASVGLGHAFSNLQHSTDAIKHYGIALEIAREQGFYRYEGEASVGLGDAYSNLRQFADAIKHYEIGLKIADRNWETFQQAKTFRKLGLAYRSLQELHEAEDNLLMCLTAAQLSGDRDMQAGVRDELGDVCNKQKDYRKARVHYNGRLSIALGMKDWEAVHKTYIKLIKVYVKLQDPANAKIVKKRADKLAADLPLLANAKMEMPSRKRRKVGTKGGKKVTPDAGDSGMTVATANGNDVGDAAGAAGPDADAQDAEEIANAWTEAEAADLILAFASSAGQPAAGAKRKDPDM